ncbi:MAG: nucleoside triphosphate pyrophosphatase [Candidatus Saelkia tenebricola]|nr:nucleoside triphosphate pyrophosphatase [Candidatus Saelkia tenebricola]
MPEIILASKSKARQRLFKQIGLKFKAVSSGVKEERSQDIKCSDLVIMNALKKAEHVAEKYSSGIVIGADTVVLLGKKLIGKPKNKKSAFEILKSISQKPHWVYTGLAVIDIDKKNVFTVYDKTKVYMRSLDDIQIKKYIKKSSLLDKAGAFDISGLGGVFIERIEGCFYNVVGLPLAKLAIILKKAGVDVL